MKKGKIGFCLLIALLLSLACDKEEEAFPNNYDPPDWIIGSWTYKHSSGKKFNFTFSKDSSCEVDFNGKKTCLDEGHFIANEFKQTLVGNVYTMNFTKANMVLVIKKTSKTAITILANPRFDAEFVAAGIPTANSYIFNKD